MSLNYLKPHTFLFLLLALSFFACQSRKSEKGIFKEYALHEKHFIEDQIDIIIGETASVLVLDGTIIVPQKKQPQLIKVYLMI